MIFAACLLFSTISVTDGDTFKVRGEPIRIMGMDAPETRFARCEREKRHGKQATINLKNLLKHKCITLDRRKKDRYKRTLAYVYADGVDVATIAIKQGWARSYHGEKRKSWCNE